MVVTKDAIVTRRYANGVEEAHDAQSVLVVETNGFRVLQHWVAGPRAGTTSVLIDKLPGFPDGISKVRNLAVADLCVQDRMRTKGACEPKTSLWQQS